MFTRATFIPPDSELIRESVCVCVKLILDEKSTWHKSNRGIEKNIDGLYTKTKQKGGFSKLCVNIKNRIAS
jgi:hypothetical protein